MFLIDAQEYMQHFVAENANKYKNDENINTKIKSKIFNKMAKPKLIVIRS